MSWDTGTPGCWRRSPARQQDLLLEEEPQFQHSFSIIVKSLGAARPAAEVPSGSLRKERLPLLCRPMGRLGFLAFREVKGGVWVKCGSSVIQIAAILSLPHTRVSDSLKVVIVAPPPSCY